MSRPSISSRILLFVVALTVLACSRGREELEPPRPQVPLIESPEDEATVSELPDPSFGAAAAVRRHHPLDLPALPAAARPTAPVPEGFERVGIAPPEAVSNEAVETPPAE
jgi:hypothetical protein